MSTVEKQCSKSVNHVLTQQWHMHRGDPSGKPLSREDTANYVSQSQRYADSHDKGKAIDSMQDISRHVRHHKDRSIHGGASQHSKASASSESSRGRAYYSIHGGRLRFEDPGDDNDSSSKGDISSQGSEKTVRSGWSRVYGAS